MRSSYLVNNYAAGHSVIRSTGKGKFLTSSAKIRDVAYSLLSLADTMDGDFSASAFNQEEYRAKVCTALATDIAVKGTWHFDEKLIDKPSVYFAVFSEYPNLVKVGKSKRMSKRSKEISRDNLNSDVKIVAQVITPRHHDLEYYLHKSFYQSRVFLEFFQADRVNWYLSYVKGLLTNG